MTKCQIHRARDVADAGDIVEAGHGDIEPDSGLVNFGIPIATIEKGEGQ